MKTQTAWGIYIGDVLLPYSIRWTRKTAIKDIESRGISKWPQLRRIGYSAVKVVVSPRTL